MYVSVVIAQSELPGCVLKSHSGQLSIAASKNPSVVNTTCIIPLCSCDYLCNFSIKRNVVTDAGSGRNEI